MSVIQNALKTAQREKQRRDSRGAGAPDSAALLVPLRARPAPRFSWQRAVTLGFAGVVVATSAVLIVQRVRENSRRPIPIPTPLLISEGPLAAPTPDTVRPVRRDPAGVVPSARQAGQVARGDSAPASTPAPPIGQTSSQPVATGQRDTAYAVLQGENTAGAGVAAQPAAPRARVQQGRLRIDVELPREADVARLFAAGVAAHRAGDHAAARASYERVLAIVPNDVDALNNMGVVLSAQRELERAELLLRRAVGLSPKNAAAWNNLGSVLRERGQSSEAIAAFEQALSVDPQHQGARVNLAQQYLAINSLPRARQLLEEVLAANPAAPEAYYTLGQVLELQGDRAGAMRAYGNFVRLAPPRLAVHVERVRRRMETLGGSR